VVIYDWKDVMTSFPGCCIQPSRLLDLFIHSLSASFGWSSSTSQLNTFFFSASLAAFDFAYNLSIRIIRPTAPESKAAVLTACIPTPEQQGSHYRGAFFLIRFVSFLLILGQTASVYSVILAPHPYFIYSIFKLTLLYYYLVLSFYIFVQIHPVYTHHSDIPPA
jgi:hypothetical protein